jgi:hypothetical protein
MTETRNWYCPHPAGSGDCGLLCRPNSCSRPMRPRVTYVNVTIRSEADLVRAIGAERLAELRAAEKSDV